MVETVIEIPTSPMLFLHFHIAKVNKQFDIFARPKNNIMISASLNLQIYQKATQRKQKITSGGGECQAQFVCCMAGAE